MKKYPTLIYEHYNSILDDDKHETNTKSACGGVSAKEFLRVDTECLGDFFVEVAKPTSSYVTYVNGIAKESAGKQVPMQHVSAMVKFYKGKNRFPCNEEICSRLSNAFGIPTVYNRIFKDNDRMCNVSIDFVPYCDKRYDTLQNGYSACTRRKNIPEVIGIEQWHSFFMSSGLTNPYTKKLVPLRECSKLFRQFVPMYLFRRHIVQDKDFDINNICVIYDPETKTYSLGPNYDMERTFTAYFDNSYKRHYDDLCSDLKFIYICEPSLAEDFVSKVQRLKATKAINIHMFDSEMSIMQRYKKYKHVKDKMNLMLKANMDVKKEYGIDNTFAM